MGCNELQNLFKFGYTTPVVRHKNKKVDNLIIRLILGSPPIYPKQYN